VDDPRTELIALSLLPILWWRDAGDWLRAGASPESVLTRLVQERLPHQPHRRAELIDRATAAAARGIAGGLTLISWIDPLYPDALRTIVDPPPALWVRGALDSFRRPAVAIVGSRAGTPYAIEVAERLAADLAARGVAIVSGLARGVDAAAHRGALEAIGSTLAVLGCGADVMYPREHDALARRIQVDGLVMSELVPGTPPLPAFFPQRNRLISGLSRAVVVVEAGEKSGSLITARCALEQGRDVLAVPGNVMTGRNRGGHALLRDGAKIVECADDILEELGPGPAIGPLLTAPEDTVLDSLAIGEPSDLDGIAERSGLKPAEILARLCELELQGIVRRAGGGRFVRLTDRARV
jgi:DNA processing protein